ncbi:MAG: cytochrome c biogenesis protein CcsA [Deltaproteobacteria bacterium]|nr:cytochrome c biogenesis protein CcsA [Deltaproteobacteria bacterium]
MNKTLLLGALGVLVMLVGHGIGLFYAPPEAYMGDTGRILYVHVPTAWVGMLALTAAFAMAVGALWNGKAIWDSYMEASIEVGVVFSAMLLAQGSIWAKPTWNTWWTWDPRLTTSAIMVVAFIGVLLLRGAVHSPSRRMAFSAVATIIAFVDVPVVYFSVEWWETTHQGFSGRDNVDAVMRFPLLVSLAGTTLLGLAFIKARQRIAWARHLEEERAPDLPETPAPLSLPDPSNQKENLG